MFDTICPDLDIESNGFDLLMQEEPDVFYRLIDHEFNQSKKLNSIGIKVNTSDAKWCMRTLYDKMNAH